MVIDKIKIELPALNSMEIVRVRLDVPRVVEYKDGRKTNENIKTLIPKELQNYNGVEGIYFICKDEKIIYIGQTNNLYGRVCTQSKLKKNRDIKSIYFYRQKGIKLRKFFEMIYKYYYLNKIDFEEYYNQKY